MTIRISQLAFVAIISIKHPVSPPWFPIHTSDKNNGNTINEL